MTKRTPVFLTMLVAMLVFAAACGTSTSETSTGGSADTDTDTTEVAESSDSSDEANRRTATASTETPDFAAAGDTASTTTEGRLGELLFANTFASSNAPTSLRFEGVFSMTGAPGSEAPGTFALRIDGALDTEAEAMRTTVDFSELAALAAASGEDLGAEGISMAAIFEDPMEMIVIGDRGWVRWGLLALFFGENVWVEMEADDVDTTTNDLGAFGTTGDPTEMLEQLADANASIEKIGVETINGAQTDHWRALVDLEQLAAQATPEERAELEEQFGEIGQEPFPIDVWIGVDDGLIYRYRVDVPLVALAANEGDIELTAASLQFDFFDYGKAVDIAPPPADEVRSGEELFGSFASD